MRPLLSSALIGVIIAFAIQSVAPKAIAAPWRSDQSSEIGSIQTSYALALLYCQDLLVKFMLASHGKSDAEKLQALRDAERAIEAFAKQQRSILQVTSVDEMQALDKRIFPDFWRLGEEIEFRKSTEPPPFFLVTTSSNEVDQELEARLIDQERVLREQPFLPNLLDWVGGQVNEVEVRKTLLAYFADPLMVHAPLALVPDHVRLKLIELFHSRVDAALARIDSVGTFISSSSSIALPSKAFQRFFEIMLSEYFKNLDHASKLDIVASMLRLPYGASDIDRFAVLVMNAGPQFQKLFQVYARQEGFSEELKSVFKRLEQNTKPIPWRIVKPIIMSQQVPFTWLAIDSEPLGIGTMAQVHKASIRLADGSERKVVVRLLKPAIAERVKIDNKVLERVAAVADADPILREENFPKMTPFLKEIEEMTTNETELNRTIADQREGGAVYAREVKLRSGNFNGTVLFKAPGIYDTGADSKIMVQEFIEGTSFEKFANREPALARTVIETLVRHWLEQTLVGPGFFHADLHQGNLRVHKENDRVTVNILDFGMTGRLDRTLQDRFIAFGVVADSKNADAMARVLWTLSVPQENQISVKQLERVFSAELERQKQLGIEKWPFHDWIALAVNAGIRFPKEFTTLNRGMVLVLRMLEDSGSALDFKQVVKGILIRNPKRLLDARSSVPSFGYAEWMKLIFSQVGSQDGSQVGSTEASKDLSDPARSRRLENAGPATSPAAILCRDIFTPARTGS